MAMEILVATGNRAKLEELSSMLPDDIQWKTLKDFPSAAEVIEDGQTFAENAQKKAIGYAKQTGLWTIADDSGLVIDALDGDPGVHSARFSGEKLPQDKRTDIDYRNITKVLELMKDIEKEKRTARFVCHLCLASPEKVIFDTEGTVEGSIAFEMQGENGFGYDPIFFIPEKNKTAAQLTREEKNAISHRGNAIYKLKSQINELIADFG